MHYQRMDPQPSKTAKSAGTEVAKEMKAHKPVDMPQAQAVCLADEWYWRIRLPGAK